jgi:hypothetical protein
MINKLVLKHLKKLKNKNNNSNSNRNNLQNSCKISDFCYSCSHCKSCHLYEKDQCMQITLKPILLEFTFLGNKYRQDVQITLEAPYVTSLCNCNKFVAKTNTNTFLLEYIWISRCLGWNFNNPWKTAGTWQIQTMKSPEYRRLVLPTQRIGTTNRP